MSERNAVRILRLIEYRYKTTEFAAEDQIRWVQGFSNQHVSMRSASLPWELVEWQEPNPVKLDDPGERVREALDWLVRLKDGPRDEAYYAAKDAAWERARRILGKL